MTQSDRPADRFAELWTEYLEGRLDEAGLAELQALLAADEQLQRRAADLFQAHRLLGFIEQDGAAVGEAFVRETVASLPRNDAEFVATVMRQLPSVAPGSTAAMASSTSRAGRLFDVRTWAALACGLLFGMVTTSAAWVYATPRPPDPVNLVVLHDGFEAGPPPRATGIPVEAGVWAGDFCGLTPQKHRVQPLGGGQMLQFERADYENKPNPGISYVSDIYRLIDVRSQRALLEEGNAVVELSAGFNAGEFPAAEKYQGSVSVFALDAAMAGDGSTRIGATLQTDSLAYARGPRLAIDRDPDTWQRLTGELRLPPNTDFVLIRIGVAHATAAQRRPDFPGHYLDDVRVVLTERPPLP